MYHRPVLRRVFVATVALLVGPLLGIAVATPAARPAGAAVTMQLTALENAQLQRLNDWRASQGLPRLQIDPVTQLSARGWAWTMGMQGVLRHSSTAGADCQEASSNCTLWAENVGFSTAGEASVFDAFLGSSAHAANMRRPDVDRVGIGVYTDAGGNTWVTQRFIRCGCTNDATATAANARRSHDQHYAAALYQDLLDRSGSSGEVNAVTDRLTYLAPRANIVSGFATSDEWIAQVVNGYYRSILGRSVDGGGLRSWVDAYHHGLPPAAIAVSLYGSDEFFSESGSTNRRWVDALYRDIFGRAPDSSGLEHWTSVADDGVARPAIANALYQSRESRQTRVSGLYQDLLGRAPDGAGLASWVDVLANGQDIQLASALAQSDEYYARTQTTG